MRRPLLFALGWVFFGLGVAGTVLPVLPTTPFMLLALWAFSSSSERFHAWLWNHRTFGPPLRRWHEQRTIAPGVKVFALTSLLASWCWMTFVARLAPWVIVATTPIFAYGAWFVGRIPTRPASVARSPSDGPGANGEEVARRDAGDGLSS